MRHRGIEWHSVRARARERERERERVSRIKSRSVHFGGRGVAISNQMDRSNNHGVRVTTCGVFVTTRCACSRRDEGKTSLRGGCKAVGATACNTACRESGDNRRGPNQSFGPRPHTFTPSLPKSASPPPPPPAPQGCAPQLPSSPHVHRRRP